MPSPALDDVVLLTGRGGSGTRLLSQLAEELGIFIGNHVNRSGDSIEWAQLVYRLAIDAAGSLELPSGSRYRAALRDKATQILDAGPRGAPLWGLKLPETMLVLPLLVDAFPTAKVVHLTRHPIPSSLRRTHMTSRVDTAIGAATLPNAYRYSRRAVESLPTDEVFVHNACSWNYQVGRIVRYGRQALSSARYLELRYEDVCEDPGFALARVRSLLGCEAVGHGGSIAVDPSRMGGWDPGDPRAATVWTICRETAALLDYTVEQEGAGVP
jgi:hypothetical protein